MTETAVPTGVLGKPWNIANSVLFLASDESASPLTWERSPDREFRTVRDQEIAHRIDAGLSA